MKRMLLISIILAAMLLSACAAPATTPKSASTTTPTPTLTPVQPTQPKPATFTISDLSISPAEVDIGEGVDCSVRVTNTGDLTGSYTITFMINGVTIDTGVVTLDGHAIKEIVFTTVVKGKDAAGIHSVNVNGLLGTFIVKTVPPSATFTITKFDQTYYQSTKEWSEYVYIYFDVENNGIIYLNYYKVYFTITCDDGSKIQYWTNGTDIFVGEKWPAKTITNVGSKKVVSIEVTNSELSGGTPPKIIYEITGTADEVDVTLNNATGGTEQYSKVSVPKKYSFSYFPDSFLYISAQNQGEYGTVRVSIYVDGKLFKTSSSSGAYVIASASGSK